VSIVLAAYDALVATGELRPDPEQAAAACSGSGRNSPAATSAS